MSDDRSRWDTLARRLQTSIPSIVERVAHLKRKRVRHVEWRLIKGSSTRTSTVFCTCESDRDNFLVLHSLLQLRCSWRFSSLLYHRHKWCHFFIVSASQIVNSVSITPTRSICRMISSQDAAHEFGALNTLLIVVVLGLCILAAYLIKQNSFYYLPESAAAILVGLIVGGLARYDDSPTLNVSIFTNYLIQFYHIISLC